MRNPRNDPALVETVTRHPGLEPGPMPPRACRSKAAQWRQPKRNRQILPVRVVTFNQGDFPVAQPAFDSLFARDRGLHRFGRFEPDQTRDVVLFREAVEGSIAVLDDAADQIRRRAGVERAVMAAGEDVDERITLSHAGYLAAPWAPAQGRGDEV